MESITVADTVADRRFQDNTNEVKQDYDTKLTILDGTEISDHSKDHGPRSSSILYRVDERPPVCVMVSVALQNILLGLGGALSTAYVISDVICAGPDHPIRAKLFCTTLFMTGICTTFMPLIGVRLPIFQGVCSTFLIPLIAMRSDPQWKCDVFGKTASLSNATATQNGSNYTVPGTDPEIYRKLREMMGSLILASMFEVIVGATGLVGCLLRFIGPIPISTVISLIGLSLYKIPLEYARTHWGIATMYVIT